MCACECVLGYVPAGAHGYERVRAYASAIKLQCGYLCVCARPSMCIDKQ